MNHPDIEMPDYKKLPAYIAHTDGNETDEAVIITGKDETLKIKANPDNKTITINGVEYYNKEFVDSKVSELNGLISGLSSQLSTLTGRVNALEG